MRIPILLCAMLLSVFIFTSPASAETASAAFARGKALVEAGQFEKSLPALAKAYKAKKSNRRYMQLYMQSYQIVKLQKRLKTETDPARWERIARSLHMVYFRLGLLDLQLAVDQELHKRLGTPQTASMLAETLLAHEKPAEAVKVIETVPADKLTPSTQALHALALLKSGKKAEAKKLADSLDLTEAKGPGLPYRAARLFGALGDQKRAIASLTQAFENIAPSRLGQFKQQAQAADEFKPFVESDAFLLAMKTKSKVPESSCSGASKCSGCPSRGGCSGSK